MCDLSDVNEWILVSEGLILLAIAAIGIASLLNAGFLSAPDSPPFMIAAGLSTGGAVATLTLALNAIEAYYECTGTPSACLGDYNNLSNLLIALIVVLGIQATACVAAAVPALIPEAGQIPMLTILGALTTQLALIPSLLTFLSNFTDCMNDALSVWVYISGVLIEISIIAVVGPAWLIVLKKM